MSVLPNEPLDAQANVGPDAVTGLSDEGRSLGQLKLWRLLLPLTLVSIAIPLVWGSVQSIFMALQVQRIDPAAAAGNLALVVGIGAIASMLAAPIAGTLSDRTRSRLGGRAPWMLFGGALTLVVAVLMGTATTIPELVLCWVGLQVGTNFVYTPLSAHIPARVPLPRRGTFSAVMGTSNLVGNLLGQTLGATLSHAILLGYIVVGAVLMVSVVVFVLINARSNLDEPKVPFRISDILRTFWVSPRKYPNFAWVFFGRFLLFIGYFPLTAYTLYILQSYIGLGENAVSVVPQIGLAGLVGTFIGTPLFGFLADRLHRTKPLIVVASALLIVSFGFPLIWPTEWAMLVFSFLSGLGLGAYVSVDYVLITQVLPSTAEAGKDLGIINITTTLPQTIGVALGTLVIGVLGGYVGLFPVGMAFVALGALCLLAVRNVR